MYCSSHSHISTQVTEAIGADHVDEGGLLVSEVMILLVVINAIRIYIVRAFSHVMDPCLLNKHLVYNPSAWQSVTPPRLH